MGLIEIDFSPVVKKVMGQGPVATEAFIRKLILVIETQQNVVRQVRWSDDARAVSEKAEQDLVAFLRQENEVPAAAAAPPEP